MAATKILEQIQAALFLHRRTDGGASLAAGTDPHSKMERLVVVSFLTVPEAYQWQCAQRACRLESEHWRMLAQAHMGCFFWQQAARRPKRLRKSLNCWRAELQRIVHYQCAVARFSRRPTAADIMALWPLIDKQ